ncbi:16S rRNA (uracil(1498)-N(3))-methyltransferase [Cellulomonas fimi]|uniref:Ribosomal RNA small subunit methyltransferase E n=1 Tax=Cellulomonas fimi TaxID=1708 RepID=A0A7Y0LWD6_CELFI|nr:16S rRNA (uracil(1498)-N(3))-methyltransferase [Cellulomonas fimi]NMR19315.1 16S rRNA (uracil(1498)-N(3))-methyltransferase [Cellulomonas fimi]
MSAPVFLAEPGSLAGYDAGAVYLLEGAEARHAGVVQRRAAGERLDVVDGAGVRLVGTIEAASREEVRLLVDARIEEQPPTVALVLVQALAKGDRDELAIEASTEVGADAIVPWQAERSVVVWRGERAAKSRARWIGIVRAATKQARRAWVPPVGEAVDGTGLVARVEAVVAAGGAVLVLHGEATEPIATAELPLAEPDASGPDAASHGEGAGDRGAAGPTVMRELLVVVGPEGGISERELTALTDAGARAVRLGPHVMRTSTAGPVALAVLAQRMGRWG